MHFTWTIQVLVELEKKEVGLSGNQEAAQAPWGGAHRAAPAAAAASAKTTMTGAGTAKEAPLQPGPHNLQGRASEEFTIILSHPQKLPATACPCHGVGARSRNLSSFCLPGSHQCLLLAEPEGKAAAKEAWGT